MRVKTELTHGYIKVVPDRLELNAYKCGTVLLTEVTFDKVIEGELFSAQPEVKSPKRPVWRVAEKKGEVFVDRNSGKIIEWATAAYLYGNNILYRQEQKKP